MNYPPYDPPHASYQQGQQQYYNGQPQAPQQQRYSQYVHNVQPQYQQNGYMPPQMSLQPQLQSQQMHQPQRLPHPGPPPQNYAYQYQPQLQPQLQQHLQQQHLQHPQHPQHPQQQHHHTHQRPQQQQQQQQQHHQQTHPQHQQYPSQYPVLQMNQPMPPPLPQVAIPSPVQLHSQSPISQYGSPHFSRPPPIPSHIQRRPSASQSPVTPQVTRPPPPPASPQQPKQPPVEVDPQIVFSLAEEYFSVASKIKHEAAPDPPPDSYCEMLSYGLACLRATLIKGKLQPVAEASVRLRYASILYSETTNYMEIDDILSNGVSLCDRHRILDLKYDMTHLQARAMYTTNPKAAFKYLDKAIKDLDVNRHTPWIYAFRLLRASLSLAQRQQQETVVAINQLRQIAERAASEGDHAVAALAYGLEAHVHLNRMNNKDAIDQAQRALASARSLQLDPLVQAVPQLVVIPHFVDVACSIYQADANQCQMKMKVLQEALDSLTDSSTWSEDGVFEVPMSERTSRNMHASNKEVGAVRKNEKGQLCLRVNWLDKEQIYGFGYLINAVVMHHKTVGDDRPVAASLLQEAQMMFSHSDARLAKRLGVGESAGPTLQAYQQANKIFELFHRGRWQTAKQEMGVLEKQISNLESNSLSAWEPLLHYMEGLYHQGHGNLADAVIEYQHPSLALPEGTQYRTPYQRDLAVLAAMNLLLIIRMPSHPLHNTYAETLAELQPLTLHTPNRDIFSAYNLMRAATPDLQTTASILETKSFLQVALQAAKHTANNQLMCIVLNILSFKFFRGVVGEQAEKSGKATQTLALKGKDSLWLSVANGALSETLEAQGKSEEAKQVWNQAVELAAKLPSNMRGRIGDNQDSGLPGFSHGSA